jgi:ribose transport system substrate-binding protein
VLRRRSPRAIVASALVFLATCVSCAHTPRPTIAFIPEVTAYDRWEAAHTGSIDAVMHTEYGIYWNGPTSDSDLSAQISLLNEAIDRSYSGIIIAPLQALALMTPVRRAVSRGIPTVVIDSPLPMSPSGRLFYILNDETEEGQIAARRIGEILHGHGSVAVLGLDPDTTGIFLRVHSFEMTLADEYPDVKIVSRSMGSSSQAQAEQAAQETITTYPNINAIFTLTDTATKGAYHTLESAGQRKKIKLVACDQEYEFLYLLSEGKIDSIIAENTYTMGYRAVQMIRASRAGSPTTSMIYVKPILVTQENMNSPDLLNVLTHDARIRR